MNIGPTELIIILIIILLIFGPGRLSKVAGEFGKGIRSFREGLNSTDEQKKPDQPDQIIKTTQKEQDNDRDIN